MTSLSGCVNFGSIQQHYSPFSLGALYKSLPILGIFLFLIYTFLINPSRHDLPALLAKFQEKWPASSSCPVATTASTNISDIVFGIVASVNAWKHKRPYIEAWWQPNVTRGYVFMDNSPGEDYLPWPSASPPFRVNEDITKLRVFPRFQNPIQLRIVRTVLETFKQNDKKVKWYVMADDDTVIFIDNLVEVLAKYDHTKYLYIGTNSEAVKSNFDFSFYMAFGGAGYALSYPLMEAVASKLDECIERYSHLYTGDFILSACVADLGIALIPERGFHQIDLHGDISGLLSSHSNTPFVSLHHIDTIDPIFPSKNRSESINQLMQAAKLDHSRILHQTVCYHRPSNWTFSISWGYSLHIYESIFPRWFLRRPLETFRPWQSDARPPLYMFNTRGISSNPCEAPHAFFADSMERNLDGDQIVTTFVRRSPRGLEACSANGNHSAESITKVKVFSPITRTEEVRRDCCEVVHNVGTTDAEVRYRACIKDEIIA